MVTEPKSWCSLFTGTVQSPMQGTIDLYRSHPNNIRDNTNVFDCQLHRSLGS